MNKNNNDNSINSSSIRTLILGIVLLLLAIVMISRIFVLQIVRGEETLLNFTLKIQKERTINSSRGKIYDRNGQLLAYNELAYNITIEDIYESGSEKNTNINNTLLDVIKIVEANNDSVISDFNIILNDNNEFEFTVSDSRLLRFLADIYGHREISELKYEEETATPDEVIDYLCSYSKFGIGVSTDPLNPRDSFIPREGFTKTDIIKLINIRYAMSLNSYQKYIPTVLATDVSPETVAVIMENSDALTGIAIQEDNIRKYEDALYFSQMMGYTGKISEEELKELNGGYESEEAPDTFKKRNDYILTDMVGKAGIEKTLETYLQGVKGSETVYVNNLGRVIESKKTIDPIAGNDVYLTIDKKLQIAVYDILEQKLAGILVSKIQNIKEYNPPEGTPASKYIIPVTDVYFALFNNSIIDLKSLKSEDAGENEKAIYSAFCSKKERVYSRLNEELQTLSTPYKDLPQEYQVYESLIVNMLIETGVIKDKEIDKNDETYLNWKVEETISLRDYLEYLIAKRWIDVSKISLDQEYSDSSEVFDRLCEYINEHLETSNAFAKRLYKYMIKSEEITGKQILTCLLEQDAISITAAEEDRFTSGAISPYSFLLYLIENLYLTPGELALDPYSASCVITNMDGEALAVVSYPSYDNNRLANSIDSEYYSKLQNDLSKPLWNYATQQKTAPGSTFKMVSSTAAMNEGIVNTTQTLICKGYFNRFANEQYKCWIYPGSHGALNVSGAIENSCNSFFYEVGYQLSLDQDGNYDEEKGLKELEKYADLFGLTEKSGLEIEESDPEISDEYPVLSAIGQGTNNFTTAGLARYVLTVANEGTCYNLSLIDKITDSNGNLIKDFTPSVRNTIDMPQTYWDSLHSGMRRVVQKKAYYNDLGVNVAGKTGTAQENKSRANHALFVSYAPYENPEVAVATRIAFGYSSDYAANLTRDIYKYYFHLEDEDNILTGTAEVPDAIMSAGD
ncbi:MAG: penicillin-binding protein [Lachnospiraceae bacterium]|nr:penicillin-binding protein [Lachnospiraceae bacterium]